MKKMIPPNHPILCVCVGGGGGVWVGVGVWGGGGVTTHPCRKFN